MEILGCGVQPTASKEVLITAELWKGHFVLKPEELPVLEVFLRAKLQQPHLF